MYTDTAVRAKPHESGFTLDQGPDAGREVPLRSSVATMGGFIVERYWPGVTELDVRTVALALHVAGHNGVTYLGCILVPGDEVVMFRFEAPNAGQVEAAGIMAGLRCDRVIPAIFFDAERP